MDVNLKYNLDEYSKAMNNISTLKGEIESYRDTMITNLEQLRKDWTLDGGVAFFKSLDTDWVDEVQICIDVLDDMWNALNEGYKEYSKIEIEANSKLKI